MDDPISVVQKAVVGNSTKLVPVIKKAPGEGAVFSKLLMNLAYCGFSLYFFSASFAFSKSSTTPLIQ